MQNETVFEDTLAHDVDPDAHDDETIVFLELSFHNTSGLVLATRIEQSGHNAQVSEQIRAWARSHGGELEATVDEFGESTSFKISGVSAVASGGDEGSAGMVARVLDYWLEQYRAHGQSVFRERLVIDLPLERVSGRHAGIRHAGIRHAENPRHPARPNSTDRRSVPVLSKTSIAGSMIAGSMIAGSMIAGSMIAGTSITGSMIARRASMPTAVTTGTAPPGATASPITRSTTRSTTRLGTLLDQRLELLGGEFRLLVGDLSSIVSFEIDTRSPLLTAAQVSFRGGVTVEREAERTALDLHTLSDVRVNPQLERLHVFWARPERGRELLTQGQ